MYTYDSGYDDHGQSVIHWNRAYKISGTGYCWRVAEGKNEDVNRVRTRN